MTEREAFLAAIRAEPREDHHRLVFADWLEEYGDEPERAEFIRLQVSAPDWVFPTEEAHLRYYNEVWTLPKLTRTGPHPWSAFMYQPMDDTIPIMPANYPCVFFHRGFVRTVRMQFDNGRYLHDELWDEFEQVLIHHPVETAVCISLPFTQVINSTETITLPSPGTEFEPTRIRTEWVVKIGWRRTKTYRLDSSVSNLEISLSWNRDHLDWCIQAHRNKVALAQSPRGIIESFYPGVRFVIPGQET